jgi:hypothetical protein
VTYVLLDSSHRRISDRGCSIWSNIFGSISFVLRAREDEENRRDERSERKKERKKERKTGRVRNSNGNRTIESEYVHVLWRACEHLET